VKHAPDTLFDNVARSDTSPKTNLESLYQFLNRRAGPSWDRVRSEAEKWYEAFPRAERNHLRTRFQEDDVHQHLPAWWELYTYTLFQRLDYDVKVHPQVSASTNRKKNPDFLISRGSESIYVESATVFNGDDISDGQAYVCDCVDRAQNPDFMVDLEIESAGTKRPKERHIIRPLEEWLAGLDWADARKDLEAGVLMDSPRWRWQHPLRHGWVLDHMAIPVQPDSRGMPGRRIGIPPTPAAAFIHDVGKIRDKLEDKGSKYSSLKRPLDKPLRRWVRGAVGVAGLDVEVKSVGLWQINVTIADRLVQGRAVLCGDAAHQFPPTGGLGVNTGLQGMHNAMWKLALCVRGLAGWSLLTTYEDERREPAITTATQSLENQRNVARLAAAAYNPAGGGLGAREILRESRRYGNHLGVEFGTVYRSAAVIDDDTKPPDVEDSYCDYAPCATPGCRAPHIWLGNEREPLSTLDLFGAGFTVLTGPGGEIWRKAAADAARQLGVPIVSYAIGDPGLADHNNTFFDHYEIGHDGAVLVRPDGYVARRSATGPSDGAPLIQAVEQILDRRS
jgi:hypothetical protein